MFVAPPLSRSTRTRTHVFMHIDNPRTTKLLLNVSKVTEISVVLITLLVVRLFPRGEINSNS